MGGGSGRGEGFAARGRRFVTVVLDVPVGEGTAFDVDGDEVIAEALASDLRDAGWEPLGVSVYGLGRSSDADDA